MDDRHFSAALAMVLKHEGGYVNDPRDSGGETKYGISKRSYPHLDIKRLTTEDAMRIYRSDYWDRGRYAMIEDRDIACRCFDLGVNVGVKRSIQFLQRACNALKGPSLFGLSVDGIMGPKTAQAVNGCRPSELYDALIDQARDYYVSLNKPRFLKGWWNRLGKKNSETALPDPFAWRA